MSKATWLTWPSCSACWHSRSISWVAGWSTAGDASTDISAAGYVAMAFGIVFTLALGIGLMALIFYSNRRQ